MIQSRNGSVKKQSRYMSLLLIAILKEIFRLSISLSKNTELT